MEIQLLSLGKSFENISFFLRQIFFFSQQFIDRKYVFLPLNSYPIEESIRKILLCFLIHNLTHTNFCTIKFIHTLKTRCEIYCISESCEFHFSARCSYVSYYDFSRMKTNAYMYFMSIIIFPMGIKSVEEF